MKISALYLHFKAFSEHINKLPHNWRRSNWPVTILGFVVVIVVRGRGLFVYRSGRDVTKDTPTIFAKVRKHTAFTVTKSCKSKVNLTDDKGKCYQGKWAGLVHLSTRRDVAIDTPTIFTKVRGHTAFTVTKT